MNRRLKDTLVVGFALFSMFLGAGNLIFPPYLGLHAGENWLPVLLGFVLTGVGLPLLGVYATLRSGGTIMTMARHVGKPFGRLLGLVVVLSIGPMFAIPRTAATTFEVGVQPILPNVSIEVTCIVFFACVLFIAINNSKVIDRLGKFLTPFLLLTLFAIVAAGIFNPVGHPGAPADPVYNFAGGFTEGYQTMDALAATMFAGVALASIVARGYNNREEQLSLSIRCGVLAAVLLALVYCGLTYGGASATDVFPADIERTALLVQLTNHLLGNIGTYCLSAAVTLACLTTSVGLCVTCGEYFNELSGGRLSYKLVVIITVLVSLLISMLGVTAIINLAVPFLNLVYPVLMALILCTCFDRFIPNKNAYIGAVIGAFLISAVDALASFSSLGVSAGWIDALVAFKASLPLDGFGLAWVLPAIILAAIFSFIPRKTDTTAVEYSVYDEGKE
ncbi:MAG: branched-chain amino acid transport system II carrier protein [Peptococcaceae bacterium]|nr:branched-chain amino acid transport system II carrier protein [Peptococcaceae bacterium]